MLIFVSNFAQFVFNSTVSYLNLFIDFCTSLDLFDKQFNNKSIDAVCYDSVPSFVVDGEPDLCDSATRKSRSSSRIQCYYQNIRGLRTKSSQFFLSSTSCVYDVIALTETSLNPSIYSGELFESSEFFVYRCDRSALNSDSDLGGGVLIAVRSHISSELVTVPGTEAVELVLVKLKLERSNVFVCCVYIPSGSDVSTYRLYYDALEKTLNFIDLDSDDELWLFGDFNLSSIDWVSQTVSGNCVDDAGSGFGYENVLIPSNVGESAKAELLHLLLSADLHQMNNVLNCDGRLLDLIFTSNPFDVELNESLCPLSKIDLYHPPIEVSML